MKKYNVITQILSLGGFGRFAAFGDGGFAAALAGSGADGSN